MYGELALPQFFSLLPIFKPHLLLVSIQQDVADTMKLNHRAVSLSIIRHGDPSYGRGLFKLNNEFWVCLH